MNQPHGSDAFTLGSAALRRRAARGDTLVGTFLGMSSTVAAEVCAAGGLDWVLVDLEHGVGGEDDVSRIVPCAAAYGVPVLVRVESHERIRAGRALDLGAAGVMFPRLSAADEVRDAIGHLRYPPAGDRGVATYNRACRFGLDPAALDRSDDAVLGVVQIESSRAVDNAGAIAAIDGVDVLFVGPRDLSHDLGVPGDVRSKEFVEAIDRVRVAATAEGKACGILVADGRSARARIAEGWTFISIASDASLLAAAVSSEAASARSTGEAL